MATTRRFIARNGIDNNNHSLTNVGAAGSSLALSGGHAVTITTSGTTNITIPTSGTIITTGTSGSITNGMLANSTISGVSLGGTLGVLTMAASGIGLSGSASYNGSGAVTFTVSSNATSANTASALVARDASGNFSAGTITATLSGNASTASASTTQAHSDTSTNIATTSWVRSILGARTTSGTADWNDVSNTRPGTGYTLLLGTATNGMGGGTYYHPFNLEYSSNDGTGNVTQLAVAYGSPGNEIYMRGRYAGSWSSWVRLLNSSNYNSYSPTLTGTGASGTWGINITGNAATATSATSSSQLGGVAAANFIYGSNGSGSNSASATQNVYELAQYKSGFWDTVDASWTPDTGWWWGATFAHVSNSSSYNYSGQIVFQNGGTGDTVYVRNINGGTPSSWKRLLTSGNYNSYSPTLTGTGASGTWGINITGNAATATSATSASSATTSSQVTINYNNDTNSNYQMLWGSGNSVYGTGGVYVNPSNDYVYAGSFNASDWFRSTGNTGWYNGTHGGGIYMEDSTYVRVYNNKQFYAANIITSAASVRAPIFYDTDNTAYFIDPNSTSTISSIIINSTATFAGGTNIASNGDVYARRSSGTTGVYYFADGGSKYLYWDGSSYFFGGAGAVQTPVDVRAPIFYDYNNTSYYIDPNSTSTSIYVRGEIQNPSVWINDGDNYNGYNENIRLFNATNGVSVIAFSASGTSGTPTTSILGWSSYMERRFNDSWQDRMYNGYVEASGSYRAPLFYDSNDTSYYVDPASTSVLNQINANFLYGNIEVSTSNNSSTSYSVAGIELRESQRGGSSSYLSPRLAFHWGGVVASQLSVESSGRISVINNPGTGYESLIASIVYGDSSIRSPIFYDSNDTAYYVDAASGAVLSKLSLGTTTLTDVTLGISGSAHISGANYLYMGGSIGSSGGWGTREYQSSGVRYLNSNGFYFDNAGYGTTWALHSNGNSGNITATVDFRAPIFYDSNDTGYYLDAKSTKSLRIYGGIAQNDIVGRPVAYWGASGTSTGPVVIKFPGDTSNYGMIHAVIDVYEYNGNAAATIIVGGHNWSGSWYNSNVEVIGHTNKPVRLGAKDGKFCIVIGNSSSSWEYGQVVLRKIQNGTYYSGNMEIASGYTVAIESDTYSNISGDLRNLRTPLAFSAGTNVTAGTAVYTPIVYDSNNTGYYSDPTGSSRLSSIYCGDVYNDLGGWFRNYGATGIYNQSYGNHFYSDDTSYWNLTLGGNSSGGLRIRTNHASTVLGYVYADTNYHIGFLNNAGQWKARVVSGDYFLVDGSSARAPIFYDSNDTTWYIDAASTSNVNQMRAQYFANYHDVATDHPFGIYFSSGISTAYAIYRESGAWNHPYPDLRIAFHTGIKFGANAGYKGMNFYTDYDFATLVMSVNNADYISGGVYIHTDLRAPIMYDTNNTAYYTDPTATSRLSEVYTATLYNISLGSGYYFTGGSWGWRHQTPSGYIDFGPANTSHAHIYTDRSNFYFNKQIQLLGGSLINETDIRSAIFYDVSNTAYYTDPASTSNLYALTVSQTISGNITGTASNITSYTVNQSVGTGNNVQFNGVGVGTAGANGEVRATGNVTAYYSSDRRLKENIVSLTNALDKINNISGVEFDWTDEYIEMHGGEDGFFIRRHDVGIIAQEIQAILPEVVAERIDGYLAVRYEKIIPLLIEAVKEQQQQIQQLKLQIGA